MFANGLFKHFPQWFIAIFALIYISGYLIDFFYYSLLGITDPGSEPLKLHYIQIGLVFFLGYMIIVALLVFTVFGAARMYKAFWRDERPASNFLTSIMTIGFSLSIYIAIIFTPPQYFQINPQHLSDILKFIGVVTFSYLVVVGFDEGYKKLSDLMTSSGKTKTQIDGIHSVAEGIRSLWVVCIIFLILYFDYIIFADLFDDLKKMFIDGGWTYFAFAVMFSLVLFRVIGRLKDANKAAKDANEAQPSFAYIGVVFLGCGILFMLYFISIITYAYAIFPYITNAKGGADYTGAPHVNITLRPHGGESNAKPFLTDVLVLYTTSTAIYLANYKWPNDPCAWRALTSTPIIFGVMRTEIQSIVAAAAQSGTLHPNCNVR